jgi:hypothetical protein
MQNYRTSLLPAAGASESAERVEGDCHGSQDQTSAGVAYVRRVLTYPPMEF